MSEIFTSAEGRIVQGDPYKPQPVTDSDNKPVMGADGKPKMAVFLALAFQKSDPEAMAFVAKLEAEARAAWPQYFDATGNCTNPSFSGKIVDGDGADKKGRLHSGKDGFAGCKVVKFTRNIPPFGPPRVLEFNTTLKAWSETLPGKVKRGDYVKVTCDTQSNAPSKTDGMYMNLGEMVAFYREGVAIVGSGPTADDAFAPPPMAPGGAPATASPPPPATQAAPPPNTSYMAPPPPAEKRAPTMGPNANGLPYEAYVAQGWTDQQMLDRGIILDGVPH